MHIPVCILACAFKSSRRSCPRRPIEITAAHLSGKCVSPGLILRPRWRPIAPFSAQSRPRTRIANATPCSSDAPSSLCSGDTSLSLSSRCSNVDSQAEHHQPTMAPFKNRRGCVTVNRETLSLFFFFFLKPDRYEVTKGCYSQPKLNPERWK